MEHTHQFPVIELSGTPKERGLAHGIAVKELIVQNIAFYKTLLKLDDDTLRAQARACTEKIAAFRPEFVEEMDGIAEGANVAPDYIYMLNARTELLSLNDIVQSECATFFFKDTGLLFENWDWSEPSKDKTVLLHITLPNGRTLLTFTEAGMLGKVGMSSAGFGVAFNYLYPAHALTGVPIHALLRATLEAGSFDEAHALLSSSSWMGTSGNIMLADASGRATDFELSGAAVSTLPLQGAAMAHTNHYLGGTENVSEAGEGFLHNSLARYAHAQEILTHTQEHNKAAAMNLLLDKGAGHGTLCRDFLAEDPGDIPTGTIASLIMDLPAKTLEIALKPQSGNPQFETFSL